MKKLSLIFIFFFALSTHSAMASTKVAVKKPAPTSATTPVFTAKTSEASTAVSETASSSLNSVEGFRQATYKQIMKTTDDTQKEIDNLSTGHTATTSSKPLDGTEKPIAYIKLFLFLFLGFIFGNQIAFYGIAILLIFFILRFIYRKIRNR